MTIPGQQRLGVQRQRSRSSDVGVDPLPDPAIDMHGRRRENSSVSAMRGGTFAGSGSIGPATAGEAIISAAIE